MLVFVFAVKDLEITLTLLPTTVIERFLSDSFKNTGVVALPTKSLSKSPFGKNLLLLIGATEPPLNERLATSALNNVNVYELSCPFLVFGVIVCVIPAPVKLNEGLGNSKIGSFVCFLWKCC